jgi:hypothetical protein
MIMLRSEGLIAKLIIEINLMKFQ